MSGKLKNTVKSFVLILAFLGVVGIAGTATYVYSTYQRAGTHTEDRLVYIPKGSHFGDIVRVLKQEGVLAEDRVFHIVNRVTGRHTALKAGEYEVPASASAADISRQLATGETYDRFFTVVEGQSVRQVIAQLRAEPYLRGEITRLPPEGELLPETYHYQRGDDRQDLVDQMQRDMKETLARLWEDRAPGLPLDTPYEALVLASIVEKETAIADERDHVAAVFVNRLNKGMRLQADPTVVYALTKGEGALGRKLLRRDLEIDSPYNTYRIRLPILRRNQFRRP